MKNLNIIIDEIYKKDLSLPKLKSNETKDIIDLLNFKDGMITQGIAITSVFLIAYLGFYLTVESNIIVLIFIILFSIGIILLAYAKKNKSYSKQTIKEYLELKKYLIELNSTSRNKK